jgi:hypothetical protein
MSDPSLASFESQIEAGLRSDAGAYRAPPDTAERVHRALEHRRRARRSRSVAVVLAAVVVTCAAIAVPIALRGSAGDRPAGVPGVSLSLAYAYSSISDYDGFSGSVAAGLRVSCAPGSVTCVAGVVWEHVGGSNRNAILTLVYRDRRWALAAPLTPPHGYFDDLVSLSCFASLDCYGVVAEVNGTTLRERSLLEHFDGTHWSPVAEPPSFIAGQISCPTASTCVMVGAASQESSHSVIGVLHDGHWSLVTEFGSDDLVSVSCVSATDCWAVGGFPEYATKPLFRHQQMFVVRLSGTTWRAVPIATPQTAEGDSSARSRAPAHRPARRWGAPSARAVRTLPCSSRHSSTVGGVDKRHRRCRRP